MKLVKKTPKIKTYTYYQLKEKSTGKYIYKIMVDETDGTIAFYSHASPSAIKFTKQDLRKIDNLSDFIAQPVISRRVIEDKLK